MNLGILEGAKRPSAMRRHPLAPAAAKNVARGFSLRKSFNRQRHRACLLMEDSVSLVSWS